MIFNCFVFLFLFTRIPDITGQFCEWNQKIHLECSKISGQKNFTNILRPTLRQRKYPFVETVTLSKLLKMPCLPPPTIVKDLAIEALHLQDFVLPNWICPAFKGDRKGFKKVDKLMLTGMRGMMKWNWTDVNEYTGNSVKTFLMEAPRSEYSIRLTSQAKEFYGEHVESIEIRNINKLHLEASSLECTQCDVIRVEYCNIKVLKKEVFGSGLNRLTNLFINDNELKELPKNIFDNVLYNSTDGNLVTFYLNINENPIETLYEETFEPLKTSYKRIHITFRNSYKILKCGCHLQWLSDPVFDISSLMCVDEDGSNEYMSYFLEANNCTNT